MGAGDGRRVSTVTITACLQIARLKLEALCARVYHRVGFSLTSLLQKNDVSVLNVQEKFKKFLDLCPGNYSIENILSKFLGLLAIFGCTRTQSVCPQAIRRCFLEKKRR